MNTEEWTKSTSANSMLEGLYLHDPVYFNALMPVLHRYFLACCWKIEHLIPHKDLRSGVIGAEKWIEGGISDKELNRLNWNAEAVCFGFEYAETPEDLDAIKKVIETIESLRVLPFEEAKQRLTDAAYFVDGAMVYPQLSTAPFDEALCLSEFLCADLLREFLQPRFNGKGQNNISKLKKPFRLRTANGKAKGPLPKLS